MEAQARNELPGEELRPLPMGPVVDLINSLNTRDFCSVLLRQVNAWLRVDRCILMRMAAGAAIQAFGAQALEPLGSRGARALVAYLDRYHRADPIRRLLDAPGVRPAIAVQRERAAELPASEYRRACYDEPSIVDRLSLAKRDARGGWVILDLQRQVAAGEFAEREIETVQRVTPARRRCGRAALRRLPLRLEGRRAGRQSGWGLGSSRLLFAHRSRRGQCS